MTPFFTEADCNSNNPVTRVKAISLDKANRLLSERGKVYYAYDLTPDNFWVTENDPHLIRNFRGLMINVEPVEPDSAEKVLRDLIKWESTNGIPCNGDKAITIPLEYFERAKKLVKK